MKVFIHDLSQNEASQLNSLSEEYFVVAAEEKAAPCQGCLGCWLKTPGKCVYKDHLQSIGAVMAQADEIIVLSKNCYGGYSQGVKRVFDRAISSNLPFFTYRKGKIHHNNRYRNRPDMSVYFYGSMMEVETQIATDLVQANGVNIGLGNVKCHFLSDFRQCREGWK